MTSANDARASRRVTPWRSGLLPAFSVRRLPLFPASLVDRMLQPQIRQPIYGRIQQMIGLFSAGGEFSVLSDRWFGELTCWRIGHDDRLGSSSPNLSWQLQSGEQVVRFCSERQECTSLRREDSGSRQWTLFCQTRSQTSSASVHILQSSRISSFLSFCSS